jgi:hypothetical protein
MSGTFVPRPVVAFRVGVTGARRLPEDGEALGRIKAGVAGVLASVKELVHRYAAASGAEAVYGPGAPLLRLLSPLAEGADRLVAEAGLALGYRLEVPMPFPQDKYEDDFAGASRDEFHALLAQAGPNLLEIDGLHGEDVGNRSYEAVGRLVARNCDLLIAVWDGGPGNGRGGTADIVRFAARANQPVWWLRADGEGGPCWIESLQQLRRPDACSEAAAQARLAAYVKNLILPPAGPDGGVAPPLRQFLAEAPLPKRWLWQSYARVMRLVAGPVRRPKPATPVAPAGEVWPYWERFYHPPDRLSVDYGSRYRSSYVVVFGLAAGALWASVLGSGFGAWSLAANGAELILLVLIAALVFRNVEGRWHEKLITYRLLGELFRKQQALALLGWSVPAAEATHISGDVDELGVLPLDMQPRDVWVGWYFNAAVRAAPLPRGMLGGAALRDAWQAIGGSLVAGQVEYHDQRRRESRVAAEKFGQLGRLFFLGTFCLVALKLPLIGVHIMRTKTLGGITEQATDAVRILQGLLPGLSAGFVGIRGYAELELVADQSTQMKRIMSNADEILKSLDLTAPLASQDLGAVTLSLADAMLRDIKGWAQLFRIKVVEPGG